MIFYNHQLFQLIGFFILQLTEFFDAEIKKIEVTLLVNQNNNSNILAYSKAVYIDSNDDVILLN